MVSAAFFFLLLIQSFTAKRNFVCGLMSVSVPRSSAVLETENRLYLFL